ncbi:MAG: mechanosensitive ion channel family protein [Schwartzia sp.]|nr:mechanosensitive ion channel family protein [Schwartzia sp. (in: firmicutes)]
MSSLGFLTWQTVGGMVVLPLGVIVLCVLFGEAVTRRVKTAIREERYSDSSFMGVFLHSLKSLPTLLGLLLGLYCAVNAAPVPQFAEEMAENIFFTLSAWMVATFLQRTLCQVIELRMGKGGGYSNSLFLNLVSAVIYIVTFVLVLDFYGISVTPIITALGVGGMAVALGLQETMANIFAGMHILLTDQIRIGDHIRLENGAEGQITDITWRYARIHTVTNNVIVVPNNKLAASIITNYDMSADGAMIASIEDVAFVVPLGVAYDSDLEQVERVTLEVARETLRRLDPSLNIAEGAPTAPAVRFYNFGDSSIDFNVHLHTTTFRQQYVIRHEFIKALKKRYEEEGIEIPFPIRTVRMERESG